MCERVFGIAFVHRGWPLITGGRALKPLLPAWLIRCGGILIAFSLLPLTSCGRSGPEVVHVDGIVTFGGGAWPRHGYIYFLPVKSDTDPVTRAASAPFDTDGRFSPTSYQPGDGLCPGKYQVYVQCWTVEPVTGGPYPPSHVPLKYRTPATSGLEVTVPPGQGRMEVKLDVPKS
jgi:hypothetical protein